MKRRNLVLVGVFLAGTILLRECSYRAGQRDAALRESGRQTDSAAAVTDRRVSLLLKENSELQRTLSDISKDLDEKRQIVARLRGRISLTRDSALVRDSAHVLLAERDSIIAAQETIIAQQDTQLTLWKALAVERGDLLRDALQQRDQYRAQREAWMRKANPGIFERARQALPFVVAGVAVWEAVR